MITHYKIHPEAINFIKGSAIVLNVGGATYHFLPYWFEILHEMNGLTTMLPTSSMPDYFRTELREAQGFKPHGYLYKNVCYGSFDSIEFNNENLAKGWREQVIPIYT